MPDRDPERGVRGAPRRRPASSTVAGYEPLRVTGRCNLRCRFCSVPLGRGPDPGLAGLLRRAAEVDRGGSVEVSGGEPTLRADLPELLAEVAAAGRRPVLQTNALRCAYPGYAQALAAAGLTEALVSLHASDAPEHDALVRRPGAFALTVAGARRLREAGVRVGVNCVLTRDSLDTAVALVERLPTLLGAGVELTLSCVTPYHAAWSHRELIPTYRDVVPRLRRAARRAREHRLRLLIPDVCGPPTCRLAGLEEHSQRLRACAAGSWRAHPDKAFGAPCRGCAERAADRCDGVWSRYVELFGFERALGADGRSRVSRAWGRVGGGPGGSPSRGACGRPPGRRRTR